MKQVSILLPTAAPRAFDYGVPEGLAVGVGDVVRVPIGAKTSLGVVWGEGKADVPAGKLKYIIEKYEILPNLSAEFRTFIDWAAWYNCTNKGAMLKMLFPMESPEKKGRIRLSAAPDILVAKPAAAPALSKEQRVAAELLEKKLGAGFSVTLLDGVTGSGKTEVYFDAIEHLLKKDVENQRCGDVEKETVFTPLHSTSPPPHIPTTPHLHIPTSPSLLPQILVLLPEIALSVQWLERFEARFGFRPVVWHSHITPAKKRASWQAIVSGEARVVVGARSALFLPYKNLQLIVVDEEHDASYKQEEGVHYHARDMAIARANHTKIPVVLVSATPSLETVHNVQEKRYESAVLPLRHAEAALPNMHLLDMRSEPLDKGAFISHTLRQAIADAIKGGHQAMLFLNRRGYAPLVLCRNCGHRFQCAECSAWLVLHQKTSHKNTSNPSSLMPNAYLQCHHCNYRAPLPTHCPECKAEDSLHACGPGVERVHEEMAALMPDARIATLASDSTHSHKELTGVIEAMERGDVDILIGTQMMAKGHHFGNLTVVGVVDADLGLMGGDLRAAEKTYQLLHQIAGRAGRERFEGHVYLQSYAPDHPVMQALCAGNRDVFFAAELAARREAEMPPFSRLAAVVVEGKKEAEVITICRQLSSVTCHLSPVIIYGPAPAQLFMLRGKYRYRFLVKAARNVNLPDFMKGWVGAIAAPASVKVRVDMDPMSFL